MAIPPLPKNIAKTFLSLLLALNLSGLSSFHFAISHASDVSVGKHAEKQHKTQLVTHRRRKDLNHIYVFENSELGNRVPVILMPGRAEEYQQNAWWKKVRNMTYRDKAFNDKFKLYVYIYNSKHALKQQVQAFSDDLKKTFGHLPSSRKVFLISYSLGGVISREAMRDPEVFHRIDTMIAIGVPFHGSPIFNPEWFATYIRPSNLSPIRRWEDQLVYRFYLFNKTNLIEGLKWDNFDGSQPQFEGEWGEIQGCQIIPNSPQFKQDEVTEAIKRKTIIYASYMENEHTRSSKPGNPLANPLGLVKASTKKLPKEIVGTVLPFYGLSVHSVFNFVNYQLSRLPTYTPENPKGKNINLYKYNDGVVPLSSALFLPPRPKPYDGDLRKLVEALDVKRARIFVDIDHMELGEYSRNPKKIEALDVLHPEDGKRTPNNWIFHDLRALLEESRQMADQQAENGTRPE